MKNPFKYFPFEGVTTLDLNYLPLFPMFYLTIIASSYTVKKGIWHQLHETDYFMDKTVLQAINCTKTFCKWGYIVVFIQGTD